MNLEICFMIIFSSILLIYDICQINILKKTTDRKTTIAVALYLSIIFILWILYCFLHWKMMLGKNEKLNSNYSLEELFNQ